LGGGRGYVGSLDGSGRGKAQALKGETDAYDPVQGDRKSNIYYGRTRGSVQTWSKNWGGESIGKLSGGKRGVMKSVRTKKREDRPRGSKIKKKPRKRPVLGS